MIDSLYRSAEISCDLLFPSLPIIAPHHAINLAKASDGGTIVLHAGQTANEAAHAAFVKGTAIEK
jgi:hypothetical protein